MDDETRRREGDYSKRPFEHAPWEGIDFLVEHGANVNAQNKEGCTALMLGTADSARYLIQHNANRDIRNRRGQTAFDIFAGNFEKIQALRTQDEIVEDQNRIDQAAKYIVGAWRRTDGKGLATFQSDGTVSYRSPSGKLSHAEWSVESGVIHYRNAVDENNKPTRPWVDDKLLQIRGPDLYLSNVAGGGSIMHYRALSNAQGQS